MSVKITDNTQSIIGKINLNASIFLREMAETMVNISTPITPKKTGRLRMDVVKQVLGLGGKIIWGKKYAARQETKLAKHYTTPGTSYKYAEKGVQGGIKKTQEIAKKSGLI